MRRRIMFNNVYPVLEGLKNKKSTYLQYFIIKNVKKIKDELEIAQDLLKDEEYMEFDKKRIELCDKYAEKDEAGKSKLANGAYVIAEETKEEFDKKVSELQNEYQLIIEGYKKKEFDVLEEDIKVDFYKIALDKLPEDLTGIELSTISELMEAVIE